MAKRYKVILSPEAQANLRGIYDFISLDSPQAAAKVVDRLLERIESLDLMPERFRVVPQAMFPYEIRLLSVPPYRVLYRIAPGEVVQVLTIRHGRQRPWP